MTTYATRAGRLVLAAALLLTVAWTRADESATTLTDQERNGLVKEATNLDKQVVRQFQTGDYQAAADSLAKELAICRRLYPAEQYPRGHADLANCLNNLGFLLQTQSHYAKAEVLYREALAMSPEALPERPRRPCGQPQQSRILAAASRRQRRGDAALP